MSTRFSSADAAWLHMDRPSNLMIINSVLLFDEPVDLSRVREIIQRRLVDALPAVPATCRRESAPVATPEVGGRP